MNCYSSHACQAEAKLAKLKAKQDKRKMKEEEKVLVRKGPKSRLALCRGRISKLEKMLGKHLKYIQFMYNGFFKTATLSNKPFGCRFDAPNQCIRKLRLLLDSHFIWMVFIVFISHIYICIYICIYIRWEGTSAREI